ncbi:MAG TPA: tRNA-binding protein [Blastocatellia bacterium]|nr:tRNA-binding protein [Blastocatellia bacterium]
MNPAPVKALIDGEVFDRIDVRVGTIESVEDIPGSDKLVALQVSFGDHKRTVVAGLRKEREDPKEIQGKQALFVVNLEPRKIRGVFSEGMLFDIGYADGVRPVLAVPESRVPDGTRAG